MQDRRVQVPRPWAPALGVVLIIGAIVLADEAGATSVLRFLAGCAGAFVYWVACYRFGLFTRPYRGPYDLPEVTRWLLPAACFGVGVLAAWGVAAAARELLGHADSISPEATDSILDVLFLFVAFEVFSLLGIAAAERVGE